jgi:kinesin family protein C2/C3
MKSVKDEVIKTKRSYLEEYKYFGTKQYLKFLWFNIHCLFYDEFDVFTRFSYVGIKLKGLAEAADNYHVLLTEN